MSMIPEKYLESTVVVGQNVNGKNNWFASGFLVGRYEGLDNNNIKRYSIYLITNKHVVSGQNSIILQFNSLAGTSTQSVLLYNSGVKYYSEHPNSDVDVIACRLDINGAINNGIKATFFELDTQSLDANQMKTTGVQEGSIVYVLGFPVGISSSLVDNMFKAPTCRMGCISKISHIYFENGNNYIIDAQVYPGNSGGPVINRPEISGISGTPHNSSTNLIGIVTAYLPYNDMLVSAQTGKTMFRTEENSGLTVVITTDCIKQTVEIERTRSTGLQSNQKMIGLH